EKQIRLAVITLENLRAFISFEHPFARGGLERDRVRELAVLPVLGSTEWMLREYIKSCYEALVEQIVCLERLIGDPKEGLLVRMKPIKNWNWFSGYHLKLENREERWDEIDRLTRYIADKQIKLKKFYSISSFPE